MELALLELLHSCRRHIAVSCCCAPAIVVVFAAVDVLARMRPHL